MQQLTSIENPTFDLPDVTPGALDYMAQAHTEEMYAFVHLFRQHTPCLAYRKPTRSIVST